MKEIEAKGIVTRTPQGWFGCDFNMNIYKGCCHGCIYCDSRSDCYGIDNFEEVRAKTNALAIIESELKSKRRVGVIATGAMSDPYNPFERTKKLTREALKLIDRYGFGVSPITKSDLITRDIDIYKSIAKHSPVLVRITVTTYDDSICSKLEPNVTISSKRFTAIKELSQAGIFTGVLMTPILPFINDTEENIIQLVKATADAGGRFIYPYFAVTLRQNQREYFLSRVDRIFPGMKQKYIRNFGNNYECKSFDAQRLWKSFAGACKQYGVLYRMEDIVNGYRKEHENKQISLF